MAGTASRSVDATRAVSPPPATSARYAGQATTVLASAPSFPAEGSTARDRAEACLQHVVDYAPLERASLARTITPPPIAAASTSILADGAAHLPASVSLSPRVQLEAVDFSAAESVDASPPYPFRIVTPLKAHAWRDALRDAGLLERFGYIPAGIVSGFDMGLKREAVDSFFEHTGLQYKIYENHGSAVRHPRVIEEMLAEEIDEGRISEFFAPEVLHELVGRFRNAPLTIAAKDGSFENGRVCQDFSHPRDNPEDPSVNAGIDPEEFVCDWGTFAQCYMLAARAPEGAEVAVFDVKKAHRRIPILPWQQPFCAITWNGYTALDFCSQFGQASASGLWGRIADGFRGIFKFRFERDDVLNWADNFTFWRYPLPEGGFDVDEAGIYALGDELGWPWSPKKTTPFAPRFKYLGFDWNLETRTVAVTQSKKDKYLRAMRDWGRGATFTRREAQSLLGKLVHCSLVVPDARSRLPALSRFAGSFDNAFARHAPNAGVFDDLEWWRDKLSGSFAGMSIRQVPPPSDILLFVDASTSFGLGIVLDGEWDHWRLRTGWKDEHRDIGWAEMVAVEFGLRAALEAGIQNVHLVIKSDNTGVVGALDAGKSKNPAANKVLQRIVTLMMERGIWLATQWVPSAENLADPPSRGEPAPGRARRRFQFRLPFVLREYLECVS